MPKFSSHFYPSSFCFFIFLTRKKNKEFKQQFVSWCSVRFLDSALRSVLPGYPCGCCTSTSNTVPPGSSPNPKIPVRPRTVARKRSSDSGVFPFWKSTKKKKKKNERKIDTRDLGGTRQTNKRDFHGCLPVVIEHLGEHARMPVEKILV